MMKVRLLYCMIIMLLSPASTCIFTADLLKGHADPKLCCTGTIQLLPATIASIHGAFVPGYEQVACTWLVIDGVVEPLLCKKRAS